MAIKIVLSDKVGVRVQGTLTNEAGIKEPFDFKLVCRRLDIDTAKQATETGDQNRSFADFFAEYTDDWSGVLDADGHKVPYSPEALEQLFKIPGLGLLAYSAYFGEIAAKAKN